MTPLRMVAQQLFESGNATRGHGGCSQPSTIKAKVLCSAVTAAFIPFYSSSSSLFLHISYPRTDGLFCADRAVVERLEELEKEKRKKKSRTPTNVCVENNQEPATTMEEARAQGLKRT